MTTRTRKSTARPAAAAAAPAPVAAPPAAEVAPVAAPVKTAIARPVTCGAWVKANPDHAAAAGRLVTCKRLPRHNGDCRAHKTEAAENRAVKAATKPATKRSAKRVTQAQLLAAVDAVAAGTMTSSAYMSLVTRMGQQRAKRALKSAPAAS
jgi:hypothetical protein